MIIGLFTSCSFPQTAATQNGTPIAGELPAVLPGEEPTINATVDNSIAPTVDAPIDEAKPVPAAEASADDRANTVKTIQQRLDELGYRPGPVDGQYGKKTRAAILRFEKINQLPASGKPTGNLLKALTAGNPKPAPKTGANTTVTGALKSTQNANGALSSCSIQGHELDRSWCLPFEHAKKTSNCKAILRPDMSVVLVRCR